MRNFYEFIVLYRNEDEPDGDLLKWKDINISQYDKLPCMIDLNTITRIEVSRVDEKKATTLFLDDCTRIIVFMPYEQVKKIIIKTNQIKCFN